MADKKIETKRAFVVKDFTDAGTEQSFTASEKSNPKSYVEIEVGAFANYAAAGLVREPDADKQPATPAA